MSYTVKELFLTLQGEGAHAGTASVFLRFAGCNLWSGREQDRASAICSFCDTDFVGGTRYDESAALAAAATALWRAPGPRRIVLTGGEPLLQVDTALLAALRDHGFLIAIETNGTLAVPQGIDWVCVSPKANAPLQVARADELKLVYPQPGQDPAAFAAFEAPIRWLSPMDGPNIRENTQAAITYCLDHPQWRVNSQQHKFWNIR